MINKIAKSLSYIIIITLLALQSCSDGGSTTNSTFTKFDGPLFEVVDPNASGLDYMNKLEENLLFNNLNYDVLYSGSGVAIGDINNDGLMDVYFGGNQNNDALYLNKGDFKFENISASSGILAFGGWSTCVSMADVNQDGYLDIYVAKYLLHDPEKRRNLLFINNKDNTFTESAKSYGIDNNGYSTSANFFDYNKDGLIDLYVGNQFNPSEYYRKIEKKVDYAYTDRLYKNTGNNKFEDVTEEAGVKNYAAALSVTTADLNQDGWIDIYVANDYEEPDFMYFNNGQGGFIDVASLSLKHMSNFSMGSDIGDINNDGLVDIVTADMAAEDNFRNKTNMSGMNPSKFWSLVEAGYNYQYMFNALQLNNGAGSFSEIAQMSGVSSTDWSWSTILADFDLDGYKDLHITNGFMRDIRNKDHIHWLDKENQKLKKANLPDNEYSQRLLEMSMHAPSVKISNYAYLNNQDLTFSNVTEKWNMDAKGWSHGSAVADFDNDGDLDFVINNLNDVASLYKNLAVENDQNYIGIDISPRDQAIGSQVVIQLEDGSTIHDHVHPSRGYMSQSDHRLRIGIGGNNVKSFTVYLPNDKVVQKDNIKKNKIYKIDANSTTESGNYTRSNTLVAQKINMPVQHTENEYDDYSREVLLPYKMSSLGPAMAIGDINGDGIDDLFIGGSAGIQCATFIQNTNNEIQVLPNPVFAQHKQNEDVSAALVDVDGDNDLDLIVASGGNENSIQYYEDRLYINDGKGKFSVGTIESPSISSGEISVGDADGDGDMDVFIAGRQEPGKYGVSVSSTFYLNEGGKLLNRTEDMMPELIDLGMITDGVWDDFDEDGDQDLIVVGEWAPITIFENTGDKFVKSPLPDSEGWWNTVHKSDIDNDGDQDLFVGNLGKNIKYKASVEEPFKLYAKDFDGTGTHDVYLGYYQDGVCYPVRGRQCSSEQMPFVKKKYKDYENFATASIEDVLDGMTEDASIKEAKVFENVWFENDGGKYTMHKLPNTAQISPVYTFTDIDIDGDGKNEIFAAGNYHDREVETTRSDAGTGFILKYKDGDLKVMRSNETGIYADGDVRESGKMTLNSGQTLLVAANNNSEFDGWIFQGKSLE